MKEEDVAATLNKVRAFIEREAIIPSPVGEESKVRLLFIALSGGADSTALLLIMNELGYKLHALHCNFNLRGAESDRDQAFVEELCRKYDVPLSVRHFNTEEYAREHDISMEMAARELRYEWFNEERRKEKSPAFIAVAHHRDDQAETILLNLLRGTGLRGLAGMAPSHEGIVRPLLCLSRKEILQYLESRGQSYVTDSTNAERIAQRNKLRLDVIPLLREMNPSAVGHLCLASDNIRQSLPYYIKGIEVAFKELGITADAFPLSAVSSRTLLHEWLAGKGFNAAQEEEMLLGLCHGTSASPTGKMWHSASHTVLRDREVLLLSPRKRDEESLPQLHQEMLCPPVSFRKGDEGKVAYFDADLLAGPIEVRRVREGDAFVPFGMTGRKLVSDFLTDRKVNRLEKAATFVATCGGDIIWLIGYRSDNRFRVTPATSRILKLSVEL